MRHFPPPPTRYGPVIAQTKTAHASARVEVPPPPTRYGAVPVPPARGAPPVVVQRMEEEKTEGSIGERLARIHKGGRFKSTRLKEKYGGGSARYEPYPSRQKRQKGIWNNTRSQ
jgi:hypothetical protein